MSKASTFLRSVLGGLKSTTNQVNGGSLIVLVSTSIFNSELIQSNPEWVTTGASALAIFNLIQRSRKGHKPLAQR